MSSRKATESFCFVHTTQYIYEQDNKRALERLGRQATFKFRALWSVRDGNGLICIIVMWEIFFRRIKYIVRRYILSADLKKFLFSLNSNMFEGKLLYIFIAE